MSLRELFMLVRRHLFAVALVVIIAAVTAFTFKHEQPPYTETGTVAVAPDVLNTLEPTGVNGSYMYEGSLITTCQMALLQLDGLQGRILLQQAGIASFADQAGVNADFSAMLISSSNEDNPSYARPYMQVSATGPSKAATRRDFHEGLKVLTKELRSSPSAFYYTNKHRLSVYVLSDSGPISQRGSLSRSYAGLLFLTLIMIFLTCRTLDKYAAR